MDRVAQLQQQLELYKHTLYQEGFLDDQFDHLRMLEDEKNPNFMVEVVSLFFEDSQRLLNELANALSQETVDFKRVDTLIHQVKGSTASVGAQRVHKVCLPFRNYCEEANVEGCLKCLHYMKQEYLLVKNKLETLFQVPNWSKNFAKHLAHGQSSEYHCTNLPQAWKDRIPPMVVHTYKNLCKSMKVREVETIGATMYISSRPCEERDGRLPSSAMCSHSTA